jgi:hypothetical protein
METSETNNGPGKGFSLFKAAVLLAFSIKFSMSLIPNSGMLVVLFCVLVMLGAVLNLIVSVVRAFLP